MSEPPYPFPRRSLDAHKGSVGTVLVVAGSRGMAGAAALVADAALRSGAGLVTVAAPDQAERVIAVKTTCATTAPLPETERGTLAAAALEPLLELVPTRDALAIGPGLSRHPETVGLVRALVAELGRRGAPPAVIDADGLNAFQGAPELLQAIGARAEGPTLHPRAVLTPHPGELMRLIGCDKEALAARRPELVREAVDRTGAVVLLKGRRTLVGAPGGALWENETGNPGMATGGAGDVLTGVIGALLAAGLAPFQAACLGAWLHGRAGDLVARRTGWAPLIATDLLTGLVEAIAYEESRA